MNRSFGEVLLLLASIFLLVFALACCTSNVGERPLASSVNAVVNGTSGGLDDFANCLTSKNFTFYGTFWCDHCTSEKTLFGSSMQFVNYVECSNPDKSIKKECLDANVNAFPTFIFGDGSRLMGTTALEVLSSKTGCALPAGSKKTPDVLASYVTRKPADIVLSADQLPSGYHLMVQNASDTTVLNYFGSTSTDASTMDVTSIGIKLFLLNVIPDDSVLSTVCSGGSALDAEVVGDGAIACKFSTTPIHYAYNFHTRNVLVEVYIYSNTFTDSQAVEYLASLATNQLISIDKASPPKLIFNPSSYTFTAPESLDVTIGELYTYSFCDPEPSSPTSPCGPLPETTNPTGGQPSYHFQLGAGTGFPPFGLTLGKDGILHGTVDSAVTPGSYPIEVCVTDLGGNSVCRTVTINVAQPAAPAPVPQATSVSVVVASKSCKFWLTDSNGKTSDLAAVTITASGPVGSEVLPGPCRRNSDCGSWQPTNDNTCVRQEGDPESTTFTAHDCTIDENRPNYYRVTIYGASLADSQIAYYSCP